MALIQIVAVAVCRMHPVRLCQVSQGTVRLAFIDARVDRIEVILAEEDDGKFVQRRKVCALMKDAFLDRRIAKERDSHFTVAHALVGERAADSDRNRARDDRNARHDTLRDIHQVHGTTAAADASRCLAANLRHHAFEIAALGEIMRVATVRAVDLVRRFKRRAGTDRDRFLANRKVDRAAHLTFSVMIRDRLLDQANAKHLAVQINLPLGVKRPDGGETLARCGNCVHAEQSRSCQVLVCRCVTAFHARRHPVWSPSGSQRAPAAQSAKPSLSEDAAELSHVVSDVYSSICCRNRRFYRKCAAKLAGARRFSAEPPYYDQPACKPGSVWPAARAT